MSASPAALFEILEGCFSRGFGKGSFFLVLVSFLWPFAQHCTTWDYYSVEMDPFNDGLLFLRGQLFFITSGNLYILRTETSRTGEVTFKL